MGGREGDAQCDIIQSSCYYEDCTCILKLQATCCGATKALALVCCDIMVNTLTHRVSVAIKYLWVDIPIFTEQFWNV